MDIKQRIHNDRRKPMIKKVMRIVFNPVTNIVIGAVFLLLVFNGAIKMYHYYNDNPYLLELQHIVSEQYGNDFSVAIDCSKNEKISMVVIESTDEIYSSRDIFLKVDSIQKTVFEYIKQHRERFCDIDSFVPKSYEEGQEKEGVEVNFECSDYTNSSGLSNVFCFFNNLEYKDENAYGFNSVIINTRFYYSDDYNSNIKVSELVNFNDVNYIQCWNIIADAEDALSLKKMKNLKEITVGEYAEEIKKVAKEMGIKCD